MVIVEENYQTPTLEETPSETTNNKGIKNKFKNVKFPRKYSGVLGLVLVIALIGGGAYIYQNQVAKPSPDNVLGANNEDAQKENEKAIKKVKALTLVPADETPEVATIADITKLGNQPFFSRAQNGDMVIIYRTSKRVVLYRPSTNMVIETGPLVEPTPTP